MYSMISEYLIEENVDGSDNVLTWGVIPKFACRFWKKVQNTYQGSRCADQNLNPGAPEYKERVRSIN
jgi:hypothetical protein